MNMRVSSVSKFPDKIYVGYASRSELDFLRIIDKVRETTEFSEEDIEYSQTLGMLFVRPCILPLFECQELKSPLYSWDGDLFKEIAIIRFEYKQFTNQTKINWHMMLGLPVSCNLDYQKDIVNILCENGKITSFAHPGDEGETKLMTAMGLNKLEKYYERKPLWSDS